MPASRHHPVVRVTHWINVIALTLMVGSGLRIFNAYAAFARRGEEFCCYPFAGRPIPDWLTFGGWLAGARNWHFAMMWVLVINGLVYLAWVYLHGEWRDLVPRRGDPRDAWQMIRFYLFLRPRHPHQGKHNVLQKLTYFSLPLIAVVAVLSGLAIWKPVSLGLLTDLFGGYVWARYWHFLAMLGLVALSAIHIFMVFAVDPYSIVSMVTGRYDPEWSPEARNARFPPLEGSHYLPVRHEEAPVGPGSAKPIPSVHSDSSDGPTSPGRGDSGRATIAAEDRGDLGLPLDPDPLADSADTAAGSRTGDPRPREFGEGRVGEDDDAAQSGDSTTGRDR